MGCGQNDEPTKSSNASDVQSQCCSGGESACSSRYSRETVREPPIKDTRLEVVELSQLSCAHNQGSLAAQTQCKDAQCSELAAKCVPKSQPDDCCGDGGFSASTELESTPVSSARCDNDRRKVIRIGDCTKPCCSDTKVVACKGDMSKDATICPCCIKSALSQSESSLRMRMERITSAARYLHRCCQAFADLCCFQPSHSDSASCCSTDCSDEKTPLLADHHVPKTPDGLATIESLLRASCAPTADDKIGGTKNGLAEVAVKSFTLEIGGMDCLDCLNKIKRAFKQLRGATVTSMDYMRALIHVEYDAEVTDPEAVAIFVARSTGFSAMVSGRDPADKSSHLELTLQFPVLPPPALYASFGTYQVQSIRSIWSPFSRAGRIHFSLSDDRGSTPVPRKLLKVLRPYRPVLVHNSTRHARQAAKDLSHVAARAIASTLLTIPILVLAWATRLPLYHSKISETVQFVLASGIVATAYPIYSASFRSAVYLHEADLGVLVSISTLTTYIFSAVVYAFHLANSPFAETLFETLGLLVTLIYVGRTLQHLARRAALNAATTAGHGGPEETLLVGEEGTLHPIGQERSIHPHLLHYDDILRLAEGSIAPTDGVVLSGSAAVDEAAVTGESCPVRRGAGSTVLAGTTIKEGTVDIQVTRLQSNNSLSAIARSLSDHDGTSRFYDLADRLAGWLLWVAVAAGNLSLVIWMLIARYIRQESWTSAVTLGVKHLIAVMAVACPCALVLSVSLVAASGLCLGLKHRIAFRSLSALFSANSIQAYAFDKTGTLSQGVLAVSALLHDKSPIIDRLVHELTSSNRHPISVAIRRHLEEVPRSHPTERLLTSVSVVPGCGVLADFYGYPVVAGNAEYTGTTDHPEVQKLLQSGHSLFLVTIGSRLIAGYGLLDRPRQGALELVASLQPKYCVILSGDNSQAVHRFATNLGIEAIGGLSPLGKAAEIKRLSDKYGKVAFVGDGTNDTLALEAAAFSVAVGSGSDIAASAASVVLLTQDIPAAIQSAVRAAQTTRLHLFAGFVWCVVYFAFAILLAGGAFVNFSIPPEWAGLGEVVSVAPVFIICANLRYKRLKTVVRPKREGVRSLV